MAKSKYDTHVKDKLILIEGWARDGLIDEQIAHNLGISKDTFYKYKREYPDFSNALKRGKEVADYEVENALFKRACGYSVKEVSIENSAKNGRKVTRTKKHIAPDTTAIIFWLKNRKPEQWNENRANSAEANGKINELIEAVKGIE